MRAFLVYLPYIIALSYQNTPAVSYWVAWGGSWFIIFITLTGIAGNKPKDLVFSKQFLRPYIFTQLYFAGYNCLTSIFYFADLNGYFFLERIGMEMTTDSGYLVANCQRYYVLAHAAFIHGMLIVLPRYNKIIYKNNVNVTSDLLTKIMIGAYILLFIIRLSGVFSAIQGTINMLFIMASALLVTISLEEKRNIFRSIIIYLFVFSLGLATGMKGAIVTSLLVLLVNLFSRYRLITIVLTIIFLNSISYIPIISKQVREATWYDGQGTALDGLENAYKEITSIKTEEESEKLKKEEWLLLTHRLSEISMFVQYTEYVPQQRDFYGLEIIKDAFMGLIPRGIRPDGKSIDETAMERAYAAGALDRFVGQAGTSAKPSMVADSYLMGGELGIFLVALLYGLIAGIMSIICETYFGGYMIGTALIYNSCFMIFWSGSCTENMFSGIFYACIAVLLFYRIAKYFNILKPQE